MRLAERLISNHPLVNIAFAVVIAMGVVAYLGLPREQDPEINFNWVNVSTALPGASASDVEERVTNPLEDALRSVQDIKFVASSSREGISNILVRFRDMPERQFDKRVNDLRREIQNAAAVELPIDAIDPEVLEITTSNGFPTAMVLLSGSQDDETLRFAAQSVRKDLEQIVGVDRVLALGFHEPELVAQFDPDVIAARGVNAVQLAEALRGHFRDVFAGKARAGDAEWLVRVQGTTPDAGALADFSLRLADGSQVPLDALATVARSHDDPRQLVASNGSPAVLLSVTKVGRVNTLELVERIQAYVDRQNPVIAQQGLRLSLSDDQTIPTREALGIMQSNAAIGLLLVLGVCWLFLGSRIASLVTLGVVFSVSGTLMVLFATHNTLNVSVLLGIVIVLGMLVDDAVVVVEAMYFRLQRGQEAMSAALDSLREVGMPVIAAVATTMAAGHRRQVHVRDPVRGDGGAGGKPGRSDMDAARPRGHAWQQGTHALAHPSDARARDSASAAQLRPRADPRDASARPLPGSGTGTFPGRGRGGGVGPGTHAVLRLRSAAHFLRQRRHALGRVDRVDHSPHAGSRSHRAQAPAPRRRALGGVDGGYQVHRDGACLW